MTTHDLDDLVTKCVAMHEAVMEHGTAEMQAFSKALMHALATLVARDILGTADGHGVE